MQFFSKRPFQTEALCKGEFEEARVCRELAFLANYLVSPSALYVLRQRFIEAEKHITTTSKLSNGWLMVM